MQGEKRLVSWRGAWLGIWLLALLPGAVRAASFDCAKAAAKVEKAICADQDLSRLDERMAAAYKKQLGAWQGGIADYVRYDQREFNKGLRSAHEGEIEDALECAKAYVACVRRLLGARVALLESPSYAVGGVYQRSGAKLLVRPRAEGDFDVLLFHKASNVIRSTLKTEAAGAVKLQSGASGFVASDLLVSRLGEGPAGQATRDGCEVRLQMSGRDAQLVQSGKCGADFAGKYQRNPRDRVENYEQEIN